MTRRNPHGELRGFGKKDAKYIEQSDTKCPSCNSSTSIISDSNRKGFVKTCDASNCGWHQILYGAESFNADKGTRKCYGCDVFIPQGDMAGMIKNQRGNEKWICRPCRGKTITRPHLYGSIGLQRIQSKHPENVFDKMPDLPQRTVGMIPCIICKDDEFEDKLNKAGVCQNCLRRATNKFVPFIPKEMGAESFEARDDGFKETNWTFEDLEEERKGPSVLRPERTYNREDAEIEDMIDRVMERLYYFRKMYYTAKKERNRKAMYLAIRNFKALEGVNQALRWTLGEKGVAHPLY